MFAATIGFFDGVHRGHRCLLEQVRALAAQEGLRSMVVTFDRHPREIVDPTYVPALLTTTEEKVALLHEAGIDEVRTLRFDREMSLLPALDFMRMARDAMGVRVLVMGYDHRFGHDGHQNPDYQALGRSLGVRVVMAHELDGMKASSSVARRLLAQGRVAEAAGVLGYDYRLRGRVVHGHQLGRTLGFPTANLSVPRGKIMPADAVYAAWATTDDGRRHEAVLNIGNRPTIEDGDGAVTLEVFLLDFEGDLYGRPLQVEFVERLRGEQRFDGLEELKAQVQADAARARALLRQDAELGA